MTDICSEVEKFGKGIGNGSRYKIIEVLFSGEATVSELVKKTKLSQSLVSQHLRVLRETKLVQDTRKGQEVVYQLNGKHIVTLLKHLTKELDSSKKK